MSLISKVDSKKLPRSIAQLKLAALFDQNTDTRPLMRFADLLRLRGLMLALVGYCVATVLAWIVLPYYAFHGLLVILVCTNALVYILMFGTDRTNQSTRPATRFDTKFPLSLNILCGLGFPVFAMSCFVAHVRSFNERIPDLRPDARRLPLIEVAHVIKEWNDCLKVLERKFGDQPWQRMTNPELNRLLRQQGALWAIIQETDKHLAYYPLHVPLRHVPEDLKNIDLQREWLLLELMDFTEECPPLPDET